MGLDGPAHSGGRFELDNTPAVLAVHYGSWDPPKQPFQTSGGIVLATLKLVGKPDPQLKSCLFPLSGSKALPGEEIYSVVGVNFFPAANLKKHKQHHPTAQE